MRYSKQREVIYQAVISNAVHPTADTVYGILKAEHPNLSLATVYRNLNFLSEQGMITKLAMSDGSDRFDGNRDTHYHMVCVSCGKVFDLPLSSLRCIEKEAEEKTGFVVTSHRLMLYGYCVGCKESEDLQILKKSE